MGKHFQVSNIKGDEILVSKTWGVDNDERHKSQQKRKKEESHSSLVFLHRYTKKGYQVSGKEKLT